MKAGPFISMLAGVFSVEEKTVFTFHRFLREGGLITTGARGVNAPDMTPLDAARMVIALLACDTPKQGVERVPRFGQLRPKTFGDSCAWRESFTPDEFASLFPGAETLEEVLVFIFSRYLDQDSEDASRWFGENVFSLTIRPGDLWAELVQWVYDDPGEAGKIIRERVISFRGDRFDPEYPHIPRGLLVERTAAPINLSAVALHLWADTQSVEEGVAALLAPFARERADGH
ncbi:hypothetical protein [uncultured Sphingomonas sp.]|uniref:hypothetical protein n=1 Tax=uncultured Sphingomonas sp. TaxID=158754 RepID=UPI0025FFCC77|nr:hypothetical protein [uncultured Sphingomonas sp.]